MSTKFNGVPYIVQRAAEALYSPEGREQVRGLIEHYMGNARILREAVGAGRPEGLGRRKRPVHLGQGARRHHELGDVRPHAQR